MTKIWYYDGGKERMSVLANSSDRKTVGHHAVELQKKPDEKINSIELQRAIHKGKKSEDSFENQVQLAIESGEKDFEGDFFVVVLLKKERILKNIIRSYFFARKSCPTPEYDQVVYQYSRKDQKIDLLWVVPNKQVVIDMVMIGDRLPKDQQELVKFAKDFNMGELDKKCDKLNGEQWTL